MKTTRRSSFAAALPIIAIAMLCGARSVTAEDSVLGAGAITPRAFDAAGNELTDSVAVTRAPISALNGGETITLTSTKNGPEIARVLLAANRPIDYAIAMGETRVLRFSPASSGEASCDVTAASTHIASTRMLALAHADRTRAFVIAGDNATFAIDVDAESRTCLTVEIDALVGRGRLENSKGVIATISCVAADDALAAIDLVRTTAFIGLATEAAVALDTIDARAAPPAFVLSRRIVVDSGAAVIVESVRRGALGRPLDLFASDGIPSLWEEFAKSSSESVRLVLVDAGAEARTVPIKSSDLGPEFSEFEIRDLESGEDLGRSRDLALIPLAAGSRRRLEIGKVTPPDSPGLAAPKVVLVHGSSPLERFAVEKIAGDAPDLQARVFGALRENGIAFVALKGAGDLQTVPPAIATSLIPVILPYRGMKRSESLRGGLERIAQMASNVEWSLGFPTQPIDSRDWLVCLEAGFYATPLQPRLVDGMPAARGFAVFMNPGLVVVTSGLSDSELDRMAKDVAEPKAANEVLLRVVDAQQAVRLSREPTGLFKSLSRYPRWTPEDFVPGDPIVMMRWAAMASAASRRQLRSLPVKAGGPALPEDVYEFTSPVQFAVDLPQPFRQPVIAIMRSVSDDSAEVLLTYNDLPLDRIASTKTTPGLWHEEIFVVRPEMFVSQVRVALALSPQGGVGRVARVAFLASRKDEGLPLSLMTPSGILPGPAAVGLSHRLDGTPIVDRDEAEFNGLEIATGGAISFALQKETRPKRLEFKATAPQDATKGGGGWLVVRADGVEKARYELTPEAREPVSAKLEIPGAREVEFRVEPRNSIDSSVLVLDPRVR